MKIYNTMSRTLIEFNHDKNITIKIYSCGPTVYNYAHIGNLRTYILQDFIVKSLNFLGYSTFRVMNITDIGHLTDDSDQGEDKLIKQALKEKRDPLELAEYYKEKFFKDSEKLNIKKPDKTPQASKYIDEMIDFIKLLEKKDLIYIKNNVYFDTSKISDYGKLISTNKLDVLDSNDKNKKNPQDFVLWFNDSKFKNHILKWESPWGWGYPGWHLECSAMSYTLLGETFDIHMGGIDHIPIHHTNEIAQSEGAFSLNNWVKYWMHFAFLLIKDNKMSKSKDNFLTLDKLNKEYCTSMQYRYFVLNSNYKSELVFSDNSINSAKTGYNRLKNNLKYLLFFESKKENINKNTFDLYIEKFKKALSNNFNSAVALSILWELTKDKNVDDNTKYFLIQEFDTVLSLDLFVKEEKNLKESLFTEKEIEDFIEKRKIAKENKDFKEADKIREFLKENGIELLDTKEKTTYIIKNAEIK